MNPTESVSLTLTVGEWRKLLDHVFWAGLDLERANSLERQLDEIVAAADAKEKR